MIRPIAPISCTIRKKIPQIYFVLEIGSGEYISLEGGSYMSKYLEMIDITKYFKYQLLMQLGDKIIRTAIILIVCKLAIKFGNKFIEAVFNNDDKKYLKLGGRKAQTLGTIIKSVFNYLIYFFAILTILDDIFGIKTNTILTSVGILGLAISFGAQNLVKDVISGFFILLEDQFAVSDYITTSGVAGYVEEFGLRITRLRDLSGQLHIIPNRMINQLTNHTRGSMQAVVDINISYEEDLDRILELLEGLCQKVNKESDNILEGPKVMGVEALSTYNLVIRIIAKTKPMRQWEVERYLRRKIKELFDNYGIEVPYPKQISIDVASNRETRMARYMG